MKTFEAIAAGLANFLKYGPTALMAVQSVEAAVGAGNGASKLQLATAAVLSVAHAGETVPVLQVQVVSVLIDTIVSTLNAMGALKKAAPVTVAAIPAPAA